MNKLLIAFCLSIAFSALGLAAFNLLEAKSINRDSQVTLSHDFNEMQKRLNSLQKKVSKLEKRRCKCEFKQPAEIIDIPTEYNRFKLEW